MIRGELGYMEVYGEWLMNTLVEASAEEPIMISIGEVWEPIDSRCHDEAGGNKACVHVPRELYHDARMNVNLMWTLDFDQ